VDSITQAALGAAVAEAGMGRRLGNKAIVWGVALGTLPDLDIIAYPWLDHIGQLEWHRGWSHSLLLMVLASPFIGWLVAKIHRGKVSVAQAAWTVFAILATHVLIDVFTVYGTMVFAPFSDYRAGWNNLFIIDPLFTAPLILGLGIAIFSRKNQRLRRLANTVGLVLATLYAAWSLGAKAVAESRMRTALGEAGIEHRRFVSNPTPFNTLLWRGLAEREGDFVITYHSLINSGAAPTFDVIPKNHETLAPIADSREVRCLAWFSDGFFSVRQTDRGWLVSDWRFGEWRTADGPFSETNPPVSIFSWLLEPDGASVKLTPLRARVDFPFQLSRLAERLFPANQE
jgi:inner membrane protein